MRLNLIFHYENQKVAILFCFFVVILEYISFFSNLINYINFIFETSLTRFHCFLIFNFFFNPRENGLFSLIIYEFCNIRFIYKRLGCKNEQLQQINL